jgi:protein-disulfide isomerase
MKLLRNFFIIFLMGLLFTACDKQGTSTANSNNAVLTKADVQQIVHNYLLDNPEILKQMIQKLQNQDAKRQEQAAMSAIQQNSDHIFSSPDSLVVGNLHGKVTLIEFFDYQCVHCAHMFPVIQQLIKQNKDLRVVLKEFPIFGPASQYAAAAVLAAKKQDKAEQLHKALFKSGLIEGKLTSAAVNKLAKEVGLNLTTLKHDMAADNVKSEINSNYGLAKALNIAGTPAFIVAPTPGTGEGKTTFIPGATDVATLQKAIDKA